LPASGWGGKRGSFLGCKSAAGTPADGSVWEIVHNLQLIVWEIDTAKRRPASGWEIGWRRPTSGCEIGWWRPASGWESGWASTDDPVLRVPVVVGRRVRPPEQVAHERGRGAHVMVRDAALTEVNPTLLFIVLLLLLFMFILFCF